MDRSSDARVALLSIRPEFARGILAGTKRVEFRRRAFAHPVTHVVVYATAPECRVVGYFEVAGVDVGTPEALWRRHGKIGLISHARFTDYFAGVDEGYAIQVGSVVTFPKPRSLREATGHAAPPQSFAYVENGKAHRLLATA